MLNWLCYQDASDATSEPAGGSYMWMLLIMTLSCLPPAPCSSTSDRQRIPRSQAQPNMWLPQPDSDTSRDSFLHFSLHAVMNGKPLNDPRQEEAILGHLGAVGPTM